MIIKLVLVAFFHISLAQNEGDECFLNATNSRGICTIVSQCPYARDLLKSQQIPQHCGFYNKISIVCCPDSNVNRTNFGEISQEKCLSYVKKRPRPRLGIALGTRAKKDEFPHMALLGYGESDQWLCGGSLISERFVLTAAHCLSSSQYGNVEIVRLGEISIDNTTDLNESRNYRVVQRYRHPNYKPSSIYNDIGLLKLDRNVQFNRDIQPACLYVEQNPPNLTLTITGWGQTKFQGERSSHLLQADVNLINYDECKSVYSEQTRKLQNGILEEIQICAGSPEGKDTCPVDSGGPLQVKVSDNVTKRKYHRIVGVTASGRACGFKNSIGLYTKVTSYLPWIESIVWGDEIWE